MDSIDTYQIKSKLDYVALQGMAQEKYLNVVTGHIKRLLGCVCLIPVAAFFISCFYLTKSTALMVAGAFNNFIAYFGVLLLIFLILSILDILRKIKKQNVIYKGDLRRVQEKLTYSEIYINIPKEDEEKFNGLKGIIYVSSELIKKNKKNT